jgi:multidrug efflux pump subunit AcrB
VAQIKREYLEPSRLNMRLNGQPAVGLGISIVSSGNVVDMGRAVKEKLKQITQKAPVGMEVGIVSYQSDGVSRAVNSFLINLLEALLIVFFVLLIFMGWRSSLVIGSILLLTIGGTFVAMWLWNIDLQRTSLGALILALGMLVDNAIVVTEGILIKTGQGKDSVKAAGETVKQTALPLLGATVVAVMAFASIGLSDDATGEYCRSLFQVMLISLGLSWILAVTATPLFCVTLLKPGKKAKTHENTDPYHGTIYRIYRKALGGALRFRWLTVLVMAALLAGSVYSFKYVQKSFFPDSTRPQFIVDCWMKQGDHIRETDKLAQELETFLLKQNHITSVASFVGQGSMRFALTLQPEKPNPSFAQLMVSVDDYTKIPELQKKVRDYARANCPQAQIFTRKFLLGPGAPGKIRARFSGPDPNRLRELAAQAKSIMAENPNAKDIRTDWRQRTKVIRPLFSPVEAERTGINRPQVATALKSAFEGKIAGVYREGDKLLPIIVRSPLSERKDIESINNIQIFSPVAGRMIPLRQVVSGIETTFEDPIVRRRNRMRTITVICDPAKGTADTLLSQLRPQIEALKLPAGYKLEWGGEYEDSKDSQESLFDNVPMPLLIMILSVIMLFNALRQPVIIFLCVPLSVIGVTAGLLLTNLPFGFMALLGLMSLSGMLIKNAIVLIDQIDLEAKQGKDLFSAISDASVSRVRPVTMAAVTTVLGMIPLAFDAFFNSMAVSIMSGLAFATILTLFVVPVLYAIFFKAPRNPSR